LCLVLGILKQPAKSLRCKDNVPSAFGFRSVPKEHIHEPGDAVFHHACKLGFEGIVSKPVRIALPLRPLA
jgi:hypothetical protein